MFHDAWRLRLVGVEDGGFSKEGVYRTDKALFVAVLMEGLSIDDVKVEEITVDGLDATEKLLIMLKGWDFDAVMLAGVSFAGFNLIDPTSVFKAFEKPVIIVTRTKPDNAAVKAALLGHFKDWRVRWAVFEKLGSIYEVISIPHEPPLYMEVVGADVGWALQVIRSSIACCRVPEPIRVARLIAKCLSTIYKVCDNSRTLSSKEVNPLLGC